MKSVENDLSEGVDNDRPGRTTRAIASHDLWCLADHGITGRMRHGDCQGAFHLVLVKFVRRVETMSFEHRPYGEKKHLWVKV